MMYKSWVMIIFFSFEVTLNFLIKTCLFLRFKTISILTMVMNVVYA
jgi:hypothetical protein